MSDPNSDFQSALGQFDKAGVPDDFLSPEDRDDSFTQDRDVLCCDDSDESPDGKSERVLLGESCEAADRALREGNDQERDGILPTR